MFEVRATYSLDDFQLQEMDCELERAAGMISQFGGCGVGLCNKPRDLGWEVETFEEANAMKQRLERDGVWVSIREK